jgi:hypothetical protein
MVVLTGILAALRACRRTLMSQLIDHLSGWSTYPVRGQAAVDPHHGGVR